MLPLLTETNAAPAGERRGNWTVELNRTRIF